MKTFTSFEEIEFELKKLKLERKIAIEKLKLTGHTIQDSLTPDGWVTPLLVGIKKNGIMVLLKKIFRL